MKSLTIKMDATKTDVISIEKYLAGYDRELSIYNGDFTAAWLLTNIHSSVWKIKTAKTIKKDGEYKYVQTINWHRMMADGTYLDAPENKGVIEFYQKILFILIESPTVMKNVGVTSLQGIFNALIKFVQWSFRNDVHLNTRKDLLKNLTQARLMDYFHELVNGGSFSTFNATDIISKRFNDLTGHTIRSKNIFKLNKTDRIKFITYLRDNFFYKYNNVGFEYVNRIKFIETFKLFASLTYTYRFTAFIRQFEPDFIDYNPDVLTAVNLENEYPGHTTPLINDVLSKKEDRKTVTVAINTLSEIFKLKPLFMNAIPDTETFRFNSLRSYANRYGSSGESTPWIPLPICLKALNHAIDIVLNKGDKILDCIEDVYSTLQPEGLLIYNNITQTKGIKRRYILADIFYKYKETLNIDTLYRIHGDNLPKRKYGYKRANPTLVDYIDLLSASCFIVIAGLKPIRVNELSSLKYDCLYFKDNDGYWMMQYIEKSGIQEILPEDAKPIPKISAKAIKLLQRMNNHARKYSPSKKESKYLLYSLNYGQNYLHASICDHEHIRSRLDFFCDFFEMPIDEYGRRWYINVHELRKSFLLTFFWTFKFSSLDSARWMAGHKDPEHVFHYIQSNIPGEEMVEVESEYAYQQLRLFREDNKLSEIKNIEELNDDVCKHFNVKSISELDENEIKDWIELAIETGKYEIHAYGINSLNPEDSATVAIKIA